jgi:hypothetical protein
LGKRESAGPKLPSVENRVGVNVGIFLFTHSAIQPFHSFIHSFTHVALGTVVETQKNLKAATRVAPTWKSG